MTHEVPGDLVDVKAECADGKVVSIKVRNVASFAHKLDQSFEVAGFGTTTGDTDYGGDSFVIVDATALGFELVPAEARDLAELGVRFADAAT